MRKAKDCALCRIYVPITIAEALQLAFQFHFLAQGGWRYFIAFEGGSQDSDRETSKCGF